MKIKGDLSFVEGVDYQPSSKKMPNAGEPLMEVGSVSEEELAALAKTLMTESMKKLLHQVKQ